MAPVIYTLDIETRPMEVYSWGLWNQNHYLNQIIEHGGILMFAAKEYGQKKVEHHTEWDDRDKMLRELHAIYHHADYVVTYNGASFDNKHIFRAFVEAGLPPPSPHRDIDLYRVVRKKFAFPSKKLAYVCEALGLDHKTDPGGFDTWRQILRPESDEQQQQARQAMVDYCVNDVVITEQLFERLLPWVDGLNVPLYGGDDDYAPTGCTRCKSEDIQRRGWAYTTAYRYRRYQCKKCKGWMRSKRSEPIPTELRSV